MLSHPPDRFAVTSAGARRHRRTNNSKGMVQMNWRVTIRKRIFTWCPLVAVVILLLWGVSQAQLPGYVPGMPVSVKAVISGKSVRLTWKAPSEYSELVTGYEISRASLASGPFSIIGKVGPDAQEFIDTGAKAEVIYFYINSAIEHVNFVMRHKRPCDV